MVDKATKTREVRPVDGRARADLYLAHIGRLSRARATLEAEMNEAISRIREMYRARIERLDRAIDVRTSALRRWAEAHPELFDGARSMELTHGRIGWRLGNPSLRLLGGTTWEQVLERLERRGLHDYIRMVREPDKRRMIADAGQLPLRELGVRIYQRDEFFAAPRTDDIPDTV